MPPGTLWPQIVARTAHARASGALHPIETTQTTVDDGGVRFVVRQVSSLALKPTPQESGPRPFLDPFLPHDPDLFVCDVSATHFALLNKFNVIDHHLLVVTRAFEPQEALLDRDDFAAWFACLGQFDALGFYNGGREAGASQPHKHLQIVPLPLGDAGQRLPIDTLIPAAVFEGTVGRLPGLPFEHAFARLDSGPSEHIADHALEAYRKLLDAVALHPVNIDGREHQSAPYNLLATPRWILLIPRCAEKTDGIAINALGFAGSMFVKDARQMDAVRRTGPMSILKRVSLPRRDTA